MSWKDQLRPASFRDIPFYVLEAPTTSGGGRRVVEHQFPGGDFAKYEDNGHNARKFSLTCYIWGDNYVAKRDALEAAFDKEGFGTLVHPTRGEFECMATVSDATEEGGVCTWNVEFNVKQKPIALAEPDWAPRVATAADKTVQSANDYFNNVFLASESGRLINTAVKTAQELFVPMEKALRDIADLIDAGDLANAYIDIIKGRVGGLVRDAAFYTSEFNKVFEALRGEISPADATRIYRKAFYNASSSYQYKVNTPTREKEKANTDAQRVHMRVMILSELARSMANGHYSSQEAQKSGIEFNAMIKSLLNDSLQYTNLIDQLRDLRSEVNEALESAVEKLPSLHTKVIAEPTPAALIVYELYGNLDKEEEFLRLNNITNPAFVQGEIKWSSFA